MTQKRILPTSDLGFRKVFSTIGNEYILQGFLQDVFDSDKKGRTINNVFVGNPYNIIDVNRLSTNEYKALLLNTQLDIHCTLDDGCEIAIEMQVGREKYIEERIFNNSALKYIEKYGRILYTKNKEGNSEERRGKSKYSGLKPVISLNIFCYNHFMNSQRALHFFRLYDINDQKYTLNSSRYTEIYVELEKVDAILSDNLKAWQHFMMTGEAVEGSPFYIKEAMEMLAVSNLTKEERELNEVYERNRSKLFSREAYVYEKAMTQGVAQGIEQGIEQGRFEEKIEMAKNLLQDQLSFDLISKYTGLALERIQHLKAELSG